MDRFFRVEHFLDALARVEDEIFEGGRGGVCGRLREEVSGGRGEGGGGLYGLLAVSPWRGGEVACEQAGAGGDGEGEGGGGAACGGAECTVYGGAGEHGVSSASVRVPAPENKNKSTDPPTSRHTRRYYIMPSL